MALMGWPLLNTTAVSEKELRSLTGEGIHLGCLSLIVASVYCDPTAPWWSPAVGSSQQGPSQGAPGGSASLVQGGGGDAPKRRRRIGPVKSLT